MQQNTKQQRPSSGVFRWWMVPLCLMACWLAWWGMTSWLSPKPAWSIKLTDKRMYYPIQESADHRLLLCVDLMLDSQNGTPSGLAILETATGNVLSTLTLDDVRPIDMYGNIISPRIVGNHVRWFTRQSKDDVVASHRLHRWHYRDGSLTDSKHLSSGYRQFVAGPESSSTIVLGQVFPLSVYQLGYIDNPYFTTALRVLNRLGQLPQFICYESWEIPDEPSAESRFLAHWAAPSPACGLQITTDGKWAVFTEPAGNDHLAIHRAKATGKESISGDELFQLFRSAHQGLLVYNTRTGKVQHRYNDNAAYHSVSQVTGNYLLAQSRTASTKGTVALSELVAAESTDNSKLYVNLFDQRDELFRIDEKGITKITRSQEMNQESIGSRITGSRGRLMAYDHWQSPTAELEVVGDELRIRQIWPTPPDEKLKAGNLLSTGNQAFVHTGHVGLPDSWARWLKDYPRLHEWADKLWNIFDSQPRFTVMELTPSGFLQHSFPHNHLMFVSGATQLYCYDVVRPETDDKSATLIVYRLPLKLYSPWWSRMAGLVPLLLLLAYCLRRRRVLAT